MLSTVKKLVIAGMMATTAAENDEREELYPECTTIDDLAIADKPCNRQILVDDGNLEFNYWTDVETNGLGFIYAQFEIKNYKKDNSKDNKELRMCIEIALDDDESKYEWREQIQIVGNFNTGKFNTQFYVMDKLEQAKKEDIERGGYEDETDYIVDLYQYNSFCEKSTDQPKDFLYLVDSEIFVDYQKLDKIDDGTSSAIIDFKRPLIEKNVNAMDLTRGTKYNIYLSYALHLPNDDNTKTETFAFGDNENGKPVFQDLYIQDLNIKNVDSLFPDVRSTAFKTCVQWATFSTALLSVYAASYM